MEKELKKEKIGKEEYIKKLEKLTNKYNNIWNAYYNDFSETFKLKEEQELLKKDQKEYDEYIENPDIIMTDELNSANDKKENLQKELDQIEEKLNDKNISNQEKELLLKHKEDIQFELEDIQLEIELLEVKSFANNAPEDKSDDIEDIKLDIDQENYRNTSIGSTEADYDKRLKECLEEIKKYIAENKIELCITEDENEKIKVDKYKKNKEIINKYNKKVKRIDIEKDEYSEEKNSLLKAISTVGIYERNREKIQEDNDLLQFEEEINKEKSEKELEEQNRLSFEWYENGKRFRYTEKDSTKKDKQEEKQNNNQPKEKKIDEEEEKYRNKYDKNYNEIKEVEENLNNYKEEKEKRTKEIDKATMLQVILEKITAQKGKLCTAETRNIVRDMYNDLENKLDQEEDEINKIFIKKQMESLENTGLDLTDKKIFTETIEEDILEKAEIAIEEIVEIEATFELQKELLNEDKNLEEERIKEEEKEQEDSKEENKSIAEQMDEKIQNTNYEIQGNELSNRDDDELER